MDKPIFGVSVYHLKNVFLREESITLDSKIYVIEDLQGDRPGIIRKKSASTLCPRDGRLGAAYVDCLSRHDADHVGRATHMLSYTWGYSIGDIVATLEEYCVTKNLCLRRTYIWIDCLWINQHRVVEQKETGGTGMLDFEKEFPQQLKGIGHMLALMSPWKAPVYLTRLWCIFELFTAHTTGCRIDIIMPKEEKMLLKHDILTMNKPTEGPSKSTTTTCQDGIDVLYSTLAKTRVQNAVASGERDRRSILAMIESNVGFHDLNRQVNELLREWVQRTIQKIVEEQDDTNDELFADFCNKIGLILCEHGEYDASLQMHQKALSIGRLVSEEEEETILMATTHYRIGEAQRGQGDYQNSLLEHTIAHNIRLSLWSENHPDTAESLGAIGAVLFQMGDYDGAMEKFQQCLAVQETILGSNHKQTASTYSSIGRLLKVKGDYHGALHHLNQALAIQERIIGKHPTTAETLQQIGAVYRAHCEFDTAIGKYQEALAINEVVLGTDHPQTADSYNELGMASYDKGDYESALHQESRALEIQERVLGEEHPQTAATINNLGNILLDAGRDDEALLNYERCLSIMDSILGRLHPDTAPMHSNIGQVYYSKGQYGSALDSFRTALAIKESVVGKDNSLTVGLQNRIGNCLRELGDTDGALVVFHKALACLDEDHVFFEMVQDNITRTQQEN